MATFKHKDMVVSFASLTEKEGYKNGKHLLGVYVDKTFKKNFTKEFNAIWEENKTAKAKKPVYALEDWFSVDDDSGKIIFWSNAKAGKNENGKVAITFKQGDDTKFTSKDFKKIGTGSIIDLSYDLYYFNSPDYGEMVLRSIKGVLLKKLVAYEADGGLDGDTVDMSDEDEDESVAKPAEEPIEKKKKKKKKK